jgi:hypothetical protein
MSEDQEVKKNELHDDLAAALLELRGANDLKYIEVVRGVTGGMQVKLSLRVFDLPCWIQVLGILFKEQIRAEGSGAAWRLHVCREYLLRCDRR